MTHHTHPQVGDQVQITIGLDKGKRYTVIGAYSDQVELGDENGKFIRSASAVICNVCPPPAANTDGESLAARAAGGQGAGTTRLIDPARIASFRAAWREDRQERWAAFRKQWPMHLVEIASEFGAAGLLGAALGLSLVISALERLS